MRVPEPTKGPDIGIVRVSFVCTANRARSPFAAALLRRAAEGFPIEVDSFGISRHEGQPVLAQAARTARFHGVDLASHRARSLTAGLVSEADLVVGFEPVHVAHAVVTGGVPRSRAFLLLELSRALAAVEGPAPESAAELRELIAQAHAVRAGARWPPRSIMDPAGRSDRRFVDTYEEIESIVERVAHRLLGAHGAVDGRRA